MKAFIAVFVLLGLCLFPATGFAETLQADKLYEGPVTLDVPGHNVRVKMPKGWRGMFPSGAEAFIMERSDGSDGKIFVSVDDGTPEEIKALMSQPLPIDTGIVLQPTGELAQKGDTFTRDYDVANMDQLKGYVRAKHFDGKAIASIVIAPPAALKTFQKTARSMVKSAKTFKPKVPKAAKGKTPKGKWASELADRNIYHFYTVSGHSEKTTMTFCGDGRFSRNFDLSNSSAIGSAAAVSGSSGTWSVSGDTLTLRYGDGTVVSKSLEFRNGLLYMNGDKWLREGTRCN